MVHRPHCPESLKKIVITTMKRKTKILIFFQHPPIQQQIEDEQIRTKQILERLFPDCPTGPTDYHQWIDHIATYIEQRNVAHLKQQNNNSANNSSEIISTKNHINNSDMHSDSTLTAATEDLILQNAKLQATVDEYKTIVAETVSKSKLKYLLG